MLLSMGDRNIWDAQLDMLKQMGMRFDEDGNHGVQFIAHPDVLKKFAETPRTPEQVRESEEAIQSKREEYYAQRGTRRLS